MSASETERESGGGEDRQPDAEAVEDVRERIQQLVSETDERLSELPDPDDDESIDAAVSGELSGLASDATELVETTDSRSLLAAIGLLDPDGDDESGPGSIPAAIATGDPDRVATLRTVLALSRLPIDPEEGDGEGDETGGDESDIGAVTDEGELRDRLETLHETVAGRESDEWAIPVDDAGGESTSSDGGGSDDAIKSAMRSALDGVRSDLDEIRDQFDASGDGGERSDGDAAASDSENGDEDEAADAGDEADSDDGSDLDLDADRLEALGVDREAFEGLDMDVDGDLLDTLEGLDMDVDREGLEALADADIDVSDLGTLDADLDSLSEITDLDLDTELDTDLESDLDAGGGPSGRGTRVSTMPDQNRADMTAVRRHSTMPDQQ